MGKGDTPRPVNKKVYDDNYEQVFGKHKIKTWDDAPKITEGSGADGGQDNELPEREGATDDPQAPEPMETEGPCPRCGESFWWPEDPLFDGQNRCDNCGNTWN